MKIIGLTGGVASGKNFISEIFKEFHASIFDADKVTHEIIENDKKIFEMVKKEFPKAIQNNKIDRKILGSIVFADEEKLQILENIIHPAVKKKYQEFLENSKENGVDLIVLNIPLLLEKKGYDFDILVAIITNLELRKERFVNREMKKLGEKENSDAVEILKSKFQQIASKQSSDEERIQSADNIIDGGKSYEDLKEEIAKIIKKI